MSAPRFIQISLLSSYPAALLNRDDSGLAKRMPFGGVMRTRISSQCLKRHWRMADDPYALTNIDENLTRSIRSRETFNRVILPLVVQGGVPEDAAVAILKKLADELYAGKKKDSGDGEGKDAKKGKGKKEDKPPLARSEVVVLGRPEVEYLAGEAVSIAGELGDGLKAEPKKRDAAIQDCLKERYQKASLGENLKALVAGAGIDAAMFGRFVSGDPRARVDAAVHVAHALTVHAEESETDYFSAVDDLLTGENAGSGHLGAAELTSGLYYVYVVVDVPQLTSNLTGRRAEDWLAADRTLAGRTVRNLIHLTATVSAGAKLGATAPYGYAGFVLAEAGDRQPRTLANAFENPVPLKGADIFGRTLRQLGGYLTKVDGMYGREEERWLACGEDTSDIAGLKDVARLPLGKLAEAVEARILAGA